MVRHIFPLIRKPLFYNLLTRKRAEWSSCEYVASPENNIASPKADGVHPQSSPFYLEWWYFDLSLPDGSSLALIFHVTDLIRPNAKEGSLNISLFRPEKPSVYRFLRYPRRLIVASKEKCSLIMGNNRCWVGSDGIYRITLDEPDLQGEIKFAPIVPPWKPGTGRIVFGSSDRFFSWVVPQPRANVSGHLRFGTESFEIEGVGYHDHNWGTVPLVDVFSAWSWGRIYANDFTIVYADMRLSPAYLPSRAMPFLLAAKNKHILTSFLQEHAPLDPAQDFIQNPKGVRHPKGWNISWDAAQDSLSINMTTRVVLEWADLIREHHPLTKATIGLLIARPYYIRCLTDVEGLITQNGQTIQINNGKAICEQIVLRRPVPTGCI